MDKEIYGANHSCVAKDHRNLGLNYLDQSLYTQAEYHLLRALQIAVQAFGKDDYSLVEYLSSVGELYLTQVKRIKPKEYYEKALALSIQKNGENHPLVLAIKKNIKMIDSPYTKTIEKMVHMTNNVMQYINATEEKIIN